MSAAARQAEGDGELSATLRNPALSGFSLRFSPLFMPIFFAFLTVGAPALARSNDGKTGLDLAIILATKTAPHRCFIPIVKPTDEFSYWVPVIINRAESPLFEIDTGFTGSLAIPLGFLAGLRSDGTLTKFDPDGPPVTITLADGSKTIEHTIVIREIILPGCRAFSNVPAIITPAGSDPLLGQGILAAFSSAAVDRKKRSLVLVPDGVSP